ncbi:lytic transglycosylase domain-containing protein [Xylella fastidiosa]|uniref:Lytic transglycosylase domain-containing protein n=1 Tax=Xylella fastidiosa subsp. multiplex TaxID=644357 RepID=A0AAW6HT67_XYLFS|nr:lytic transglycosylase domain-containing protein [Xylella fastidiosa]ACA12819.1 soluble lytic murein transglycosylase precursor [Xylella fastidiosa M12]MCH7233968.1 lytic transglycosylase domain-containing protein [Xylella fastidiosa subsp. multiplex]MDC6407460.1 lytic transglycosylase domain-containing protein [Xylella fastidiosa subsp. multiplex]MDD0863708.1 lytic transglycosylase domain-containing protein [Xylella fastidiosa subsp. multiplex]MDD0866121.1 lytic transglycosylase domain-con
MKSRLRIVGVLLTMIAVPAWGAALYKCLNVDGIPSYVSKRVAGATCTVVVNHVYRVPSLAVAVPAAVPVSGAVKDAVVSAPSVGGAAVMSAPVRPAVAGGGKRLVSGQVYSYIQDGVRHYSSSAPRQTASVHGLRTISYSFIETCYACAPNPGVNFGSVPLNTSAYHGEIVSAAGEFGVEEALVRAIIHAESSYNPLSLSSAGAQGLMQLMPGTARRFGVTDSYDPLQNIRGGVQYLAWLLKRFNGNLTLAAAGYNAGEGAVDRYGGVPPYSETQRYVERVNVLLGRYRAALMSTHQ